MTDSSLVGSASIMLRSLLRPDLPNTAALSVGRSRQMNSTPISGGRWQGQTRQGKLAYMTLIIGKETVAYNDRSNFADDYLERLLSFYFRMKAKIAPCAAVPGTGARGRPRKLV